MIQRKHSDFFERLTKDIARLIATLLGYNIEEAEEQLAIAYNEWFGMDRSTIDKMSTEELMSELIDNSNMEVNHLELLAELFAKEGKWYFDCKQYLKSKRKLEKALKLFDFVDREKQLFSFERQLTLQHIKSSIQTIDLHLSDNSQQ